jgi:hypothetical protein
VDCLKIEWDKIQLIEYYLRDFFRFITAIQIFEPGALSDFWQLEW